MKTKLRYTERIEFTPTSTSVQQFQFRGNGAYDPNVMGTGHQPRGFDQLMDVCQKLTMIGSQCTVQFMYEGYDEDFVDFACKPKAGPHSTTTWRPGHFVMAFRALAT